MDIGIVPLMLDIFGVAFVGSVLIYGLGLFDALLATSLAGVAFIVRESLVLK